MFISSITLTIGHNVKMKNPTKDYVLDFAWKVTWKYSNFFKESQLLIIDFSTDSLLYYWLGT